MTGQEGDGTDRSTRARLEDLERRRAEVADEARASSMAAQHARGKLSAHQRIEALLDKGTFSELDALARSRSSDLSDAQRHEGDGVVTGIGTIDGRDVCVFSQDFTVLGGSLGEVFGEKVVKVMDLALRIGCPIIGINDSGGARIEEGVASLGLYGEIFYRNTISSGVVPQISVIAGPCAGGAVYSPALTDFTVMVDRISHMFITGPDVIKAVTGQEIGLDDLGGGPTHTRRSGVAHYLAVDEQDAFDYVRSLLGYLPGNNMADPPVYPTRVDPDVNEKDRALDSVIPDSDQVPYDMHQVIETVVDEGEILEVQPAFAPNIVCGFARVEGHSVGIVANQPVQLAGTLDIDASEKAARFVRTCDSFNVPLLTFVDVPGFLPGTDQEWDGIIRRGAKLIYAYAEATVPKVTVITRKAYGGAYVVMGSKHLRADINLAWPTGEIAVMGAAGAVNILYRHQLAASGDQAGLRQQLTRDYEQQFNNPYLAADRGYVDAVIRPAETRLAVTQAFRRLRNKRSELPPKKHGNIPL